MGARKSHRLGHKSHQFPPAGTVDDFARWRHALGHEDVFLSAAESGGGGGGYGMGFPRTSTQAMYQAHVTGSTKLFAAHIHFHTDDIVRTTVGNTTRVTLKKHAQSRDDTTKYKWKGTPHVPWPTRAIRGDGGIETSPLFEGRRLPPTPRTPLQSPQAESSSPSQPRAKRAKLKPPIVPDSSGGAARRSPSRWLFPRT